MSGEPPSKRVREGLCDIVRLKHRETSMQVGT